MFECIFTVIYTEHSVIFTDYAVFFSFMFSKVTTGNDQMNNKPALSRTGRWGSRRVAVQYLNSECVLSALLGHSF